MTETPRVVVGYLDPGEWAAVFGLSYRDLLLHDLATNGYLLRPGGKELRSLTGSGGIPQNRNCTAQSFLDNTDGDWLWFLDSDMGFADDTLDRLLETADPEKRAIVGALCFQQKKCGDGPYNAVRYSIHPTVLNWAEVKETGEAGFRPQDDYKRDAVVEVAGTGMACILIHRNVLEAIREKSGEDAWYSPLTIPGAGGNDKPRTFSEDLSFCIRAAACGYKLWVDTGVKTTHYKGGIYLDEESFDAQR
jgi:glycosyltransferase involved in cell wall biosynthesis